MLKFYSESVRPIATVSHISTSEKKYFNLRLRRAYQMNYICQADFQTSTKQGSPHRIELPDQETLQEYLSYDGSTGLLFNKKGRGKAKEGEVSGCVQATRNGRKYRRISFKGKRFYAHVLIAALLGISVPSGLEIDHIDGNGLNNRIENLRIVTHAENMRNKKLKAKAH